MVSLSQCECCFYSLPQGSVSPDLNHGVERGHKIGNSICPRKQDMGCDDILVQIQ